MIDPRESTPEGDAPGPFSEELTELVSASLDGALSPDEEERLADLLAQDPQLHAYRERLRRVKRLVAGSAPLMAGAPGAGSRQDALAELQARLARASAGGEPGLGLQVKLGILACVAGLVLVSWQVVAFSRRLNDRSEAAPQKSEVSEVPEDLGGSCQIAQALP